MPTGNLTDLEVGIQVLKFVSIGIGAISGVVGTLSETHEKETRKLTKPGKWILGFLVGSSLVAVGSQTAEYLQAVDKRREEAIASEKNASAVLIAKASDDQRRKEETDRFAKLVNDLGRIQEKATTAATKSDEASQSASEAASTTVRVKDSLKNDIAPSLSRANRGIKSSVYSLQGLQTTQGNLLGKMDSSLESTWRIQRPFGTWRFHMWLDTRSLAAKQWAHEAMGTLDSETQRLISDTGAWTVERGLGAKDDGLLDSRTLDLAGGGVRIWLFRKPMQPKTGRVWIAPEEPDMILLPRPEFTDASIRFKKGTTEIESVRFRLEGSLEAASSSGAITNWVDLYDSEIVVHDVLLTRKPGDGRILSLSLGYRDTIWPRKMEVEFDATSKRINTRRESDPDFGESQVSEYFYVKRLTTHELGLVPSDFPGKLPATYDVRKSHGKL